MPTLEEIGKEMAVQKNRATQFPLFIIMADVERAVPDGCGESKRKDPDTWDSSMQLCDSCEKIHNEGGAELPDYCDECDPDFFWNCEVSQEPDLRAGVFFTAKACQEHIIENHYHYTNPQVYGIGAWRNPEMQQIMLHLIEKAGKEVPSHYK
jgi:hypothetical protein